MRVERKLWACVAVSLAMLVSACGGGSGSITGGTTGGTTSGGTTSGSTTGSTTGGSTTGSTTGGSGIAQTLTVAAGQQQVIADGAASTLITATLTDTTGAPVSGANITFQTSAGSFSGSPSKTVATDGSGVAAATLTSSTTIGNATINVSGGGVSGSAAVTFVAGPPSSIALGAAPTALAVGGTATLTASVVDAKGNPVSGESLLFQITTNATSGSFGSVSATTDANGRATTTYTSGSTAGTDTLSVRTAGGVSQSINIVSSTSNARIANVTLALPAQTAAAGGPSLAVSATVTDSNGSLVQGAAVAFTTTRGTISASANTDASGVATATLVPPTSAGPVRIDATIAGLVAEQTLTIVPGAVDATQSSITASPSTVVADGVSTTTIVVVLNDSYGNPLPDGTSVTLLSNAGTFNPSNTAQIVSGRANFTLKAPSAAATATVSVQGTPALSTTVTFSASSSGSPASIRFVASPSPRISVTGVFQQDTASITFTVLNSSGNPINESGYPTPVNNLRVQFISSPNGGETINGTDVNGALQTVGPGGNLDIVTSGGVAVVNLRAGTLPGTIELRASVLSFTGSSLNTPADIATTGQLPQLSITSGPPSTIVFSYPLTNSVENLGNGNYRRKGKVDVTDRYGNSVPDGTVVNFTLMDSVILHDNTGVTTAGAPALGRSGTSLIQRRCTVEPTASSEASGCNAAGSLTAVSDFNSTITRNGNDRGLQSGDRVLIRNAKDGDKIRTLSSVDSPLQVTMIQNYINSLVNGEFWAGASLSGAQIFGADPSGNLTVGAGVTTNGVAELRVTYPANPNTILTGCYGYPFTSTNGSAGYSDRDKRDAVPQSRQVIVGAAAGENATAVTQGTFCFSAIAGGTITPSVSSIALTKNPTAGSSRLISLDIRDGGDILPLPYDAFTCYVSSLTLANPASLFSISVTPQPNTNGDIATQVSGVGSVLITRTDTGGAFTGDTATVTCATDAGGGKIATTAITVTPILP